ncbi:hypothetical protein [Kitasatospora indigofera]|uniref:hypothetical protein n=1 Tax=Kitasatospora indigofera TaxID=67307 RepID=UPI00339F9E29
MSGRSTTHAGAHDPVPTWTPRLGDLAYDSATDQVGVVVDTPGAEVQEYRLRPESGGAECEWAAAADGSTLTPAAS